MLKYLGVSRSGYAAWKRHIPSDTAKRRKLLKDKIKKIYDDSHQNYGAPKITKELRKTGENISERTVGKYMKQMGIKAQWIRPWTVTTKDSDFSNELHKISLMSSLILNVQMQSGVQISHISGRWKVLYI